jgi:hypothetical protein
MVYGVMEEYSSEFLNFVSRCNWAVNFLFRPPYPAERECPPPRYEIVFARQTWGSEASEQHAASMFGVVIET